MRVYLDNQFQSHRINLWVPPKKFSGGLYDERISNYELIIYWKVAKEQKCQTSRSISNSSLWLQKTYKRIFRVRFLMNVSATIGQLCTREQNLEKWTSFFSLATFQYIIDPYLLIRSLRSQLWQFFWWYSHNHIVADPDSMKCLPKNTWCSLANKLALWLFIRSR